MLGASVAGSCSADAMPRAQAQGVDPVFDYRRTDFSTLSDRFDVVYDTAATMPTALGLSLARKGGVFLDINPTPIKFLRSVFSRRLKPIICTARADILDGLARAAEAGKLRLPISESVLLTAAIPLLAALEKGRKINGKALVEML
jgi:NADPH:quinone reductase-like Zn-dependent oxidoreductase